jgi:acyl carrier protein
VAVDIDPIDKETAFEIIEYAYKQVKDEYLTFTEADDVSELMDSLDAIRWIYEIETKSGVKFPDSELEQYYVVGNAVQHLIDYSRKDEL